MIPSIWMPDARIERVILHWTAGGYKATDFDRQHYHLLVENDGKLVKGVPSIALNSLPKAKAGYAAHTLNCNTGSIGVSMCCMAGAEERPLKVGKYPLTVTQWNAAAVAVAELCKRYSIPVTPKTVLSHAEVQANLGIKQRGKWDVAVLPFDPNTAKTAKACGDRFRAAVTAHMLGNLKEAITTPPAKPVQPAKPVPALPTPPAAPAAGRLAAIIKAILAIFKKGN